MSNNRLCFECEQKKHVCVILVVWRTEVQNAIFVKCSSLLVVALGCKLISKQPARGKKLAEGRASEW